MWVLLLLLVVVGGLVLAGCQATRAGYESAPYKVVRSDGKFELRDCQALTVVETPMANADGSDGFKEHRPGWAMPIHDLLVRRGGVVVFHGHDHLYAHQTRVYSGGTPRSYRSDYGAVYLDI